MFLFRSAVFEGRALFRRDIALVWLPQVETFARCIAAGSWPLWDPYRGFGQPLLADASAEVVYPPAWIHLILPPKWSYLIFVLLHLCFAALGVYNLARRWGASRVGGFAGGALWLASGPSLSLASTWHHLAGAAWMPWVMLAGDCALAAGTPWTISLWGMAIAGQILAGSFDLVVLTAAAIAVDLVVRRLQWRKVVGAENRRLAFVAASAAGLGVSLSAVQWLPTLAFALGSLREALPEFIRTRWSLPPLGILEILLPFHWAELPLRPEIARLVFGLGGSFLDFYVGVPALALAAAAFMNGKGRQALTLGTLALLGTLVALGPGGHVYTLLVSLVPPLKSFRYPIKVMVLTNLALALLAALGFDVWRRARVGPFRRWLTAGCVGMLAAVVISAYWLARTRSPLLFSQSPNVDLSVTISRLGFASVAALGAFGLALCWSLPLPSLARWAGPALAALAIGHLAFALPDVNPTARPGIYDERPAVLSALDRNAYSRLYVVDYVQLTRGQRATVPWLAGALTLDGVPAGWTSLEALSSGVLLYLHPPGAERWGRYGSYDQDLLGLAPRFVSELNRFVREAEPDSVRMRMLQMAGVSDVVALEREPWWKGLRLVAQFPSLFRNPISVLRVPDPVPRTYVVGRARVVDDADLLNAIADPSFDPKGEILVSPPATLAAAGSSVSGESRIVEYRPDRVRLEARLDAPGYVVLVDGYDPGWRVTVDARPAAILRANGAFRAVSVPAGTHRIEFVYRPAAAILGLGVTSVGLLGLFWLVARAIGGSPATDPGPPK